MRSCTHSLPLSLSVSPSLAISEDLQAFQREASYAVLARTRGVHAVQSLRGPAKTAYVFFEATNATAWELADGPVRSCSAPGLVMAERLGATRLRVTVANPQLGWTSNKSVGNGIMDPDRTHSGQAALFYLQPTVPQTTRVTLNARWSLVGPPRVSTAHIAAAAPTAYLAVNADAAGANATVVSVQSINGVSVELELELQPPEWEGVCLDQQEVGDVLNVACAAMPQLLESGVCVMDPECGWVTCPGKRPDDMHDICKP